MNKSKSKLLSLPSNIFRASIRTYSFLLFGITAALLLTGIVADFRTICLTFAVVWLLLWLKTKNMLFNGYLVAVFSLAFFAPNKYYTQEIIRGAEMLLPIYKDGYYLGYGLNVANIFILFSALILAGDYIRNKHKHTLPSRKLFTVILLCGTGFFLMGLNSSLRYSPFVALSVTWLMQYTQLFIVAALTLYIFLSDRKAFRAVYDVIIVSSVFEFIMAGIQFLRQSGMGIAVEQAGVSNYFVTGLDELDVVYRVAGSFAFHNQLALIMLIFSILLLPIVLTNTRLTRTFHLFTIGITIVLTQSRSVWLASAATVLLAIRLLNRAIRHFLTKINWKKMLIYLFAGATSVSYIIIPRILLSANAVYEGAGIPIRIRLFTEAIRSFILNPWLGYGVGTNEYVFHSLNVNSLMLVFPTAVHVGLLQLALEVGLIGLLFFLFPFGYITRAIIINWHKGKKTPEWDAYMFRFIAGSVAFFIYYLFLPHVGIIEFAYLGVILGCGCIAVSLTHETS